jgi:glucose/arabinose dehydrogenase
MGDGVNQFQVSEQPQNLDSLNGKILRMDRTGAGLPDNPFFDPNAPRSARSRVWAYGLRYPFRLSVHPRSGVLYVGEVGLHRYESIMRAAKGTQFGWPCMDAVAPHPFARFLRRCDSFRISEISARDIVYEHNRSGAAVIAGDFNFGRMLPEDAYGEFFFADFVRGWLKRASVDAEGRLFRVRPVSTKVGAVINIRSGPDGNLYVLSYGGGSLSRITASSAAAAAPSPDPAP